MRAARMYAAVSAVMLFAFVLAGTLVKADDGPIEITLERTACFGTCPVYTVTISGDGTVSYDGRQFVGVTGTQRAHVDPAVVRALVDDFKAIGFFELRDAYREVENPDGTTTSVTDLPTIRVSLRIGDRSKEVVDYFGAPKPLRDLERRIDAIAGTAKWVEAHPTRSPRAATRRTPWASCTSFGPWSSG